MSEIQNVVLVVCDALSAQRMSLYGHANETTPKISAFFSKRGEVYTNVHSNASWTFLSFPSMFRAQLPSKITVAELEENSQSFPRFLEKAGVRTYGFLANGNYKKIAILQNIERAFPEENIRMFKPEKDAACFTAVAEFLNTEPPTNQKRFVLVHDLSVHMPYNPPEQHRVLFGEKPTKKVINRAIAARMIERPYNPQFAHAAMRLYDQGVRHFDDLFDGFIASIDLKVLEKTVIILTSDHGEAFGSHMNSYNHGGHLYEELLHIPFCVYDPRTLAGTSDKPFSALDFAATVIDRLGLHQDQYESIPIALDTIVDTDRTIVAEGWRTPEINPREDLDYLTESYGEMKILQPPTQKAVIQGNLKYHAYAWGFGMEEHIYDIKNDPFETMDLLKKNPRQEKVALFYTFARKQAGLQELS